MVNSKLIQREEEEKEEEKEEGEGGEEEEEEAACLADKFSGWSGRGEEGGGEERERERKRERERERGSDGSIARNGVRNIVRSDCHEHGTFPAGE